ncbi:MAG: GldG family protein [Pseudomonadota bacterium]
MSTQHPTRAQLRLQQWIFLILFLAVIGLLGWLSTRYHFQADWTANARNTLSEASKTLLEQMQGPIEVTAFARDDESLRRPIMDVWAKYQRVKSDIRLNFINPDADPERVRDEGITVEGEMVVSYGEKRENLKSQSEQEITNTLQRLARAQERWVVFLEGHGERSPQGQANHDFIQFGAQLKQKGLNVQMLNLATQPQLPTNTSVLVIADPQTALLPGEVEIVRDFVAKGGNLLWLADGGGQPKLDALAADLGVKVLDGVIVDPTTQLLGINDPRFALIAEYSRHPVTQNLTALTLFPQARGIEVQQSGTWNTATLLATMSRSWLETDKIVDRAEFGEGDLPGPVTLAVSLTRQHSEAGREQRVAVVGDADFLANTYLGNGANLELGLNLLNWLAHDDNLVTIPAQTTVDPHLEFSPTAQGIIGFGFFLLIPGGLLLAGLLIWLKRRKR